MRVQGLSFESAFALARIFVRRGHKVSIQVEAEGLIEIYYQVEIKGVEIRDGNLVPVEEENTDDKK